jgi:hypothetical protein
MPTKSKRGTKARPIVPPVSSPAARQRGLPMPKYDYQTPRSGTFIVRYNDPKKREERAAEATMPALQNFRLVPA